MAHKRFLLFLPQYKPVSYTHLDVYQRQVEDCARDFLWAKSTEDPAALAAVRFFAAEKHMRLPQQEAVSGNPFPQISRYFPLWNQICGFWFGGPGKNRYL